IAEGEGREDRGQEGQEEGREGGGRRSGRRRGRGGCCGSGRRFRSEESPRSQEGRRQEEVVAITPIASAPRPALRVRAHIAAGGPTLPRSAGSRGRSFPGRRAAPGCWRSPRLLPR